MPTQKEVDGKSTSVISKPTGNEPKIPTPTEGTTPKSKKKVEYKYAGGGNDISGGPKTTLKRLAPTDRMAMILGFIFLAVILLALVQFPFGKLISGDINIEVKVGYPWHFLKLGLIEPGSPLQLKELILDLIVYLILAYIIDMFLKFTSKIKIKKSKEGSKKEPVIFKIPKSTIADKITKKVFKEEPSPAPKPENQPNPPAKTMEQPPNPKSKSV